MENGNWTFTTINHTARKRLSLSMNEYAYLDYIYKTQTHPDYSDNGWCNTGQEKIAEFLGLSKGAVVRISQRMVEKKLLNKTPGGRKKVTTKWYKTAYETGGSESDLLGDKGGQKVTFRGSESSRRGGQKVTHNIIVNKKENINNKKEGLEKLQELKKEEYLTSLNNDFYLIEALERKTRVSKNRILEISLEFAEEQILLENFLYPKYKDFKRHFYRWFLKQDHTRKKSTSEKRAFNQDTNTYYEPPAGGYYNPFAHKRTSEDDDYQVDLTKYVKKRV